MWQKFFFCLVFFVFPLISVSGDSRFFNPDPAVEVNVEIADVIASHVLNFALKLSNQLSSEYRKTLIFSPLSIMSSLAMLMVGARDQAVTELSTLFGISDMKTLHEQFTMMLADVEQRIKETTSPLRQLDEWHNDITDTEFRNGTQDVIIANGLFIQKKFKMNPEHIRAITNNYNSDILTVDFQNRQAPTTDAINMWVGLQSNGRIDDMIVDEFPLTTSKLLVSTLAIKAPWETDIFRELTQERDFYPNGTKINRVISVNSMTGIGDLPYYHSTKLDCHIIGIPYDGSMMTLYIIQPMNSSVERLRTLQQTLRANDIETMIERMRRRTATVELPRMHIEQILKLREPLEEMGIKGIFDELETFDNKNAARRGSFSSKVPNELTVTEILHITELAVSEKHTEASASSLLSLFRTGPQVIFRANTPFIFLVRNDLTKLPLIYSIVNEPPRTIID